MDLYLIDCESNNTLYATNAWSEGEARDKFLYEYGTHKYTIEKILVENIVLIEDNDDIIFF